MIRIAVFLSLLYGSLYAQYLQKKYFVLGNDINLSVITNDPKNDGVIYSFQRNRHIKRVRTKDLLKLLQQNGYRHFKAKTSYVTFFKLSGIDTTPLKKKLEKVYKEHYPMIDIRSIHIIPKNHLEFLPKSFAFKIRPKSVLLARSTFSIKSERKQFFFEYFIDADVYVYKAKRKIHKGEVLSGRNLKKVYVKLDKFRALPVQNYVGYQAKHHINEGKIITKRDIERLDLVRRGEFVSVVLKDSGLEISFNAKALQAGGLHDIILIQNTHGKKIKAKVIGKNLVEVEAVK